MTTPTPQPKLSVIIPVYKVEPYLHQCVDSVLGQDYDNLEVILVDDGSPDGCPQICDDYAAADSRIRVVHKSNAGLGMARNSGLEVASGDYVTFLDSDDWYNPGVLKTIMETAIRDDAGVVMYGFKRQLADGNFADELTYPEKRVFSADELPALAASFIHWRPETGRHISMSVWSALFRSDVIRHRFYSEREVASEDIAFKAQAVLQAQKVVFVPVLASCYRYNNTSLSKTYSFDKFHRFKTLSGYLRNIFSTTSLPHAGDYIMVYAMSSATQAMALSGISASERKECLRKMASLNVWDSLHIDGKVLNAKERFMYACLSRGNWAIPNMIFSLYYKLKR